MTDIFSILLRGLIIGISIAAPVGPIGVLCIRRTLTDGRLAGFLCGLGAATADMLYGTIAAFGLAFIMDLLMGQMIWLRLVGGIFLLYLGTRTIFSKPAKRAAQVRRPGLLAGYLSTLFLTLTNPVTILSFIAIFAGTMPTRTENSPLVLVLGVFAGSAFWWLVLSFSVGLMRQRLRPGSMLWINRLSGLMVVTFGVISLLSLM